MKKIKRLFYLLSLLLLVFNCTEKDNIPNNVEIQNFVWKALNLNYLWQDEANDLQDDRFNNQNELNNFLTGKTPSNLFDELLYTNDRFSWIVDDYIALEQQFAGITLNNGMEFGLKAIADDVEQIFGYVRYIIPNSNAALNNVMRGQIIYGINGTQLTRSNYRDLLFSTDTYTVDFGNYVLNSGVPEITPNGNHVTLTKEVLTENPVHTVTVNQVDSHKIGYILYNQFTNEFDSDLNDAFLYLKNENVTHLVLDLRYNGGGSVHTAVSLASMITGQFENQLFTTLNYNNKLNGLSGVQTKNFQTNLSTNQVINHLNLSKVYVLVSGNTASASELVINGLLPYIDVVIVGAKTVGKFVGSVTLYDSENYGRDGANPNHTYALQPIITELKNKLEQNNNHLGFEPNINLPEDFSDLGILGNINEALFAEAINHITTSGKFTPFVIDLPQISSSKTNFAQNNMFIELR